MSETAIVEEVLPVGKEESPANGSDGEEIRTPSDKSSVPEETHGERSTTPDQAPSSDGTAAPDVASEEAKEVTIPKPVTVEDEPEDDTPLATQTTEAPLLSDAHLTPKLSVRTTTASPKATEANLTAVTSDTTAPEAVDSQTQSTEQEGPDLAAQLPELAAIQPPLQTVAANVSLPAPSALSFLDADSPPVTKEAIRLSTLNAVRRGQPGVYSASPSAHSHSSSMGSTAYSSDVFSRANPGESVATWSPSDPYNTKPAEGHPPTQHMAPEFHRSWTSSEARMPPPPMSHIGGSPTQPRFPPPSAFQFNEQVPLSGYQLVAAKLAGDIGGMHVKPIYRRFEALNHRLLLSLQDEIGDLEEQLHNLDSADTQNRTYPGGIYPASRRQEAIHSGDLYWRKGELLAQVGHRLWQYNKLLISFRDTTDLPAPTINDIQDYRGYLTHGNYISAEETRFLGVTNDLIALDEALLRGTDEYSEDLLTPMPRSATEPEFPLQLKAAGLDGDKPRGPSKANGSVEAPKAALPPAALTHLALAIFVAVLVPIFTFAVIPDFAGRLTVVVLVVSSVLSTLMQSGIIRLLVEDRGMLALVLCVIAYGGVMSTAAATFR